MGHLIAYYIGCFLNIANRLFSGQNSKIHIRNGGDSLFKSDYFNIKDVCRANLPNIFLKSIILASIGFCFISTNPLQTNPKRLDLYRILKYQNTDKKIPTHTITRQKPPISQKRIKEYKYAQKLQKKKPKNKNQKPALKWYLRSMGYQCNQANTQTDLQNCINQKRHKNDVLFRLGIWQSAIISVNFNYKQFLYALIQKNDFTINDPLNQKIYSILLKSLFQSKSPDALKYAQKYEHIQSPMIRLWRGRILADYNQKRQAESYFFRSAASTDAWWIQKAALVEIKKHSPDIFKSKSHARNRFLTIVSIHMNGSQFKQIENILKSKKIIQSTRPELIKWDGLYFIRSRQFANLNSLSKKGYTHISRNSDILYHWASLLDKQKNYSRIYSFLKKYEHSITQNPSLWKIYLTALEKTGRKNKYYQEVVRYLNRYPSHYHIQDKLIEFLIGSNPEKNIWANRNYWSRSVVKLPQHTGNGRFIYWLKQYYKHSRQFEKLQSLNKNFYKFAPGSFYSGAFWDENLNHGDFISAWRKVKSRNDYLNWISKFGGNENAIRFLARHNITPYLDPGAVKLTKKLISSDHHINSDIVLIYNLGYKKLGHEYLKTFESFSTGRHDRYKKLSIIGRKTGNLEYSVYYTRQYAREKGISEDPFSMTSWLLKILYPRPYRKDVSRYAKKYNVETEAIYAIMRQESLFRPEAVSRSGARGLMQIMPRTGRWLANKLKIRNYDPKNTTQNIQMGSKFFADLSRSYDDFRWAAIAYNGGPGNLRKWKRKYYKGNLYHFLEHLPKEESRNYCRITYQNYMHYKTTYQLYP